MAHNSLTEPISIGCKIDHDGQKLPIDIIAYCSNNNNNIVGSKQASK